MSDHKSERESSKEVGMVTIGGHSIKNDLGNIKLFPIYNNINESSRESTNLGPIGWWIERVSKESIKDPWWLSKVNDGDVGLKGARSTEKWE